MISSSNLTLKILDYVCIRRKVTTSELCNEFGITTRTVKEHINTLRVHGYEIDSMRGRTGGYIYKSAFSYNKRTLSESELSSLINARFPLEQMNYLQLHDYEKAIAKLSMTTSESNEQVNNTIVLNWQNELSEDEAIHLEVATQAFHDRRKLKIEYKSASENKITTRYIRPYVFKNKNGAYYVEAYCELRNEVRTFKFKRIIAMTCTNIPYKVPASYSVIENNAEAIGLYKDGVYDLDVLIREPFATIVSERRYSNDQIIERIDEETIRLKCTLRGGTEIVSELLKMGSCVLDIKPDEIKKRYQDEVEKMYYQNFSK